MIGGVLFGIGVLVVAGLLIWYASWWAAPGWLLAVYMGVLSAVHYG